MKILVVAHYQGDGSPTASFIHAQVSEYIRLGHEVRVLVPIAVGKPDIHGKYFSSTVTKEQIDSVRYIFVRCLSASKYGIYSINMHWAIRTFERHFSDILEAFQPDIVHAHTFLCDSEIGAFLKQRLHCPLVVTTHGSDTFVPLQDGKADLLKKCADKADRIVCVSSKLKRALEGTGTSTPLDVIFNGFSLCNKKECEKVFLQINQTSALISQKKTDVTIRALALLHVSHPEAVLTVVGKGPDRSALEGLCKQLGIDDSVHFLGQLSNPDVLAEMARAQFFVMPSKNEGFGIVYLEAMASGCITIGTEGEGIADVIIPGKNGFLVPADDPVAISNVIEWCLSHRCEAASIAECGCHDALALTWESNARKYCELFTELSQRISS